MMGQTRKTDLMMFAKIAKAPDYASPKDVPFSILLPAFVTSELKTAFQIGFLIFLPFLVIDLIVASALMSLGMMMLSPTVISMRSEEHTSELQSLMRISYAVFCLKKKKTKT